MPGTKCAWSCFCVDCITCWFLFTRQLALALVSMLRGPHTGVRSGIRRGAGAGICSHPFSRCPSCWRSRRHPSCWCSRGVRRAGVCAGVRRAGVRAGVSCCHAGTCLAVVRAFKQAYVLLLCWHSRGHLSCCRAGICAGVRRAAIHAGIHRACWCHVLVVYRVVGAHVTISTTVKSMVSH